MPASVGQRVRLGWNRSGQAVNGGRVLLLGLTYERNTGDAGESPSLVVADRLLALGAEVRAVDPHVLEEQVDARIALVEPTTDEVSGADAVVLLVDHDAFDLTAIERDARYVLDTRHRMHGPVVEHL
jgi:UDP-N-acetyl-D-glucosamine dehydrogenase